MPVRKSYNLYHNLGYWFLSFIILVFAGFYYSYFLVLFEPKAFVIHIHFVLMALWIALLITQPFLIKYKKISIHKKVGKMSYVIVPLTLISSYLMIRYGYDAFIERISHQTDNGVPRYSEAEILHLAAKNNALPFFYFVWMGLFYILAIVNRRQSPVHARYMVAAALTILGPTVDRIFFITLNMERLPFNIPVETFSFVLIDVLLFSLLVKDIREKRNSKTLWICLSVYAISQSIYFFIPDTNWWEYLMTFIMR